MEEKHKLTEAITLAESLHMLATAYEEISVLKMRVARDKVLHTRDFLNSISAVFVNVKSSYKKKLQETAEKNKETHKIMQFRTHQTNGKEIFVLLSASNKLYGDIIIKTFSLFEDRLKNSEADIAIVGKLGKELFESHHLNRHYTYFDLPDSIHSMDELKSLINYILQYEKVTVFYGRFKNIVNQESVAENITGDEQIQEQQGQQKEYGFLFEPSVEEILAFFENQIFTSLFKQTIVEAELARFASRIKTMEYAIGYINTRITLLTTAKRHVNRHIENRKQLERIAGMKLWKVKK